MNKQKYNHVFIEEKWQKYWEDHQTFKVVVDPSKPKYYILDMFPYPSGSGLHVGHVTGYTATDILARYKRQKGFNVLHPMGWDSFGLPAEQYAIRTGTHPKITTEKNINTYRRQLKSLGFSYDWSREIATSDPSYYKWTQWIFTKLYEKGLAYEAEVTVNFCPALGTVLANEEVEDGKAKEGGYAVERRPLRQWILKITEYAERLLQDLELLDWPESLKKLQANWIGKSEGAKIVFKEELTGREIPVFTTCAYTLFGVSYIVLAPEHPLVDAITSEEAKDSVASYKKSVQSKSDLDRTDLSKEKTGVWTGAYAVHPITEDKIPIWISDYVLASYGFGAVMGVPAHDERDFAFAKAFDIKVNVVVDPGLNFEMELPEGKTHEDIRLDVLAARMPWTHKEGTLIHCQSRNLDVSGMSIASGQKAIISYLKDLGKAEVCINYKLRDWLFSRQRYWGEPFPILHLEDGTKRILELDELPLCPPELHDFKPSIDGQSPLAKVRQWMEVIDPVTGKKALRESNTMPQWAGSCWYYLRFCDPTRGDSAWGKEEEKYWMPVDLYVGGVEHAVLHLLYARFWHKVLFDLHLVSTKEPFQTLRNQGLVTARSYRREGGGYVSPDEVHQIGEDYYQIGTEEKLLSQIEKMSKSKLNGVTPDDMLQEYGADALRLYEMFMGPFDKEKLWNTDAVNGCKRFLNRVFEMATSAKIVNDDDPSCMKLASRLAFSVEKDIEAMQFNTAIAKMMEFLNDFTVLSVYSKKAVVMFIKVLSSFAPHICEELYEYLGEVGPVAFAPYPKVEEHYLVDDTALYVVQVNGKLRGKWELPKDKTEKEIVSFIKNQPNILKHIGEGDIVKIVFVPNKLINLVVR